MKENNIQIIIIPGILGSVLSSGKYQLFPPLCMMNQQWKDKITNLQSTSTGSTAAFPLLYKGLEVGMKEITDNVTVFHYDWRLDNAKNINSLKKKIDYSASEVILIAHSMGGILAKLLLVSDENDPLLSKITKLITLGTPWYGSMDAYKRILFGFGKKHGYLKDVVGKLESSYQLLPQEYYVDFIKDSYGCSFLGQKSWNEVYNNIYSELAKANNLEIDEILLDFYNKMKKPLPSSVEHHEFVGYGYPTILNYSKQGSTVTSTRGHGDCVVPIDSACSETDFKYFVEGRHNLLPLNPQITNVLKELLIEQSSYIDIRNKFALPTYDEVLEVDLNYKVVKVACPVDVALVSDGDYLEPLVFKQSDFFSTFFNESYDIDYYDDSVELLMSETEIKDVRVEAYDNGGVSVVIEQYSNGNLTKSAKFKTFNMDSSKSANITLSADVERCNIQINNGKKNEHLTPIIVPKKKQLEEKIVLPITYMTLQGDNVKEIEEGTFIATGDVYLKLDNIYEGTYGCLDTFYKVNNRHKMSMSSDSVKINLDNNKNTIRFYSVDQYNNVEREQKINVYYFKDIFDRIPKINIQVQPNKYTIEAETMRDIDRYVQLIVDGERSTMRSISILGKTRKIQFEITDILGVFKTPIFYVHEELLQEILDSTVDQEEFTSFVEGLNMVDYKYRYIRRDSFLKSTKSRFYSDFKKMEVNGANQLVIVDDKLEVNIDKVKEYNVMFSTTSEYVDLQYDETYYFEFSVFNEDLILRLNDEKFRIKLSIQTDNSSDKIDDIEQIIPNCRGDIYSFQLESRDIRQAIKKYNSSINEYKYIYISIYGDEEESKLITTRMLKIKS